MLTHHNQHYVLPLSTLTNIPSKGGQLYNDKTTMLDSIHSLEPHVIPFMLSCVFNTVPVLKKIVFDHTQGKNDLSVRAVCVWPAGIRSQAELCCGKDNNNNNKDFISKALFHVKHAQLRCTMPMNNTHTDTQILAKQNLRKKCFSVSCDGKSSARGRYHGGRRPSSDDNFHSATVIPPSALDKPSIMKRYHCR